MTIDQSETAGLVVIDVDAAHRLDSRIRLLAGNIADNIAKLGDLVAEAKEGRIHTVLRFPSWTAYLADALGGRLKLETDSRRQVVELLAGEGMSQRAIAQVVGVNHTTVSRDQAAIAADEVLHDATPDNVVGLDGKTYTRPPKPKNEPEQPVTDCPWVITDKYGNFWSGGADDDDDAWEYSPHNASGYATKKAARDAYRIAHGSKHFPRGLTIEQPSWADRTDWPALAVRDNHTPTDRNQSKPYRFLVEFMSGGPDIWVRPAMGFDFWCDGEPIVDEDDHLSRPS